MAVIDHHSSWEFEMPHNMDKKKRISLTTTVSGDTVPLLEEDETMCEDDISLGTEFVSSCMEDDDIDDITSCCSEDDIISCSSIQLDDGEMEDNIFSTRSPRRVRFSPKERTEHLIISLSEYTQEEIEEAWYSKSQQKVMNKANNKTVKRLDSGLKEKSSAPYRGLEQFGIDGHLHVEEAQRAYVDTVMDEMQRQWDETDLEEQLDWEKIACLTKEITEQSAREAFVKALFDESEARAAYQTVKVKDSKVKQPSSKRDLMAKNKSCKKKNKRDELSRLESFIQTAEEIVSPKIKTTKKPKAKTSPKPRFKFSSLLKKRTMSL